MIPFVAFLVGFYFGVFVFVLLAAYRRHDKGQSLTDLSAAEDLRKSDLV